MLDFDKINKAKDEIADILLEKYDLRPCEVSAIAGDLIVASLIAQAEYYNEENPKEWACEALDALKEDIKCC